MSPLDFQIQTRWSENPFLFRPQIANRVGEADHAARPVKSYYHKQMAARVGPHMAGGRIENGSK